MTTTGSYALIVIFELKAGSEDRFDALADTIQTATRQEHGTHAYEVHRVHGHPAQRCFYERYADEAAFREHEQTPELRAFLRDCTPLLASPPNITVLR